MSSKLGLMKNYLIIGVVFLFAVVGFFIWKTQSSQQSPVKSNESTNSQASGTQTVSLSNPKKSAHYESNTPSHGGVLAGVPINVVIDFNFDLVKQSSIKIKMEGKDYGIGETVIDDNKLSMRRKVNSNSPNGLYTVTYNACWPDGSCHDGNFEFEIRRDLKSSYEDLRNQKELIIKLSEISFKPKEVLIAKGTKITWVNDDSVEHYVNTDSHPAHTYYKEQNSKSLKRGETYSITFDKTGIYPYHCSAHADQMTGNVLVE